MQARRTACKRPEAVERFQNPLTTYATTHRRNVTWPKWYKHEDGDDQNRQHQYPDEQPHPSTGEHDDNWDDDICAMGPIGLLIESTIWHGMRIDPNLKLWQKNEEPVSILAVPYQNLKPLIMKAACSPETELSGTGGRAATEAECR